VFVVCCFVTFAASASLLSECGAPGCGQAELAADVPNVWCGLGESCPTVGVSYEEAVAELSIDALETQSRGALSIRLVLGEVGADRLLTNRYGLLEAVGVLYTLRNRRLESVWNPDGHHGAPHYPGCSLDSAWHLCADPEEYIGLRSRRALRPERVYDPEVLREAVRRAALAYWLVEHEQIPDITGGATVFVHRCGGADYGGVTPHCDAHTGAPEGDVEGADPFTGPLVFKGPRRWDAARGLYTLAVTGWVDYDPWWKRLQPLEDETDLPQMTAPTRTADGLRGDPDLDQLMEGADMPQQLEVLRALHRNGGRRTAP
jgi:hypothetical protein